MSVRYLSCCTWTVVWSKNVSPSDCIYSAFHCLCLSANPKKMSYISLFYFFFLPLPGCLSWGWAVLFIDLTWHDRDAQEDTGWSTLCHVNMHWRRRAQAGEMTERSGKHPAAAELPLLENRMFFWKTKVPYVYGTCCQFQGARNIPSQHGVVWIVGSGVPLFPSVVWCVQLSAAFTFCKEHGAVRKQFTIDERVKLLKMVEFQSAESCLVQRLVPSISLK